MAIRDNGRPKVVTDPAGHEEPWFLSRAGRGFQVIRVVPERLRFHEVDPVFGLVAGRLGGVKLEAHTV
jgi:hypothetical protein